MDDAKRAYREAENKTKETLRRSDGEESVSDKIGNAGDDIRAGLGNAGDEAREELDKNKFRQEHGEDPV
jgi:ribosomal protein L15